MENAPSETSIAWKPVFYLHGFLGAPADWDFIQETIPGAALDLPDAFSWEESVRQIGELLPASSVLVGYSMGARLALGVGLAYPDRLAGLVIESGALGLPESDRTARLDTDTSRANQLEQDYASFLAAWYRQPLFASLSDEQVRGLTADRLARDPATMARILRTLTVAKQPDYRSELASCTLPVLAIAGEADAKYTALAGELGEACPNGNVCIIPGAGHNVHLERPEAFTAALKNFLETV